MKTTTAIALLAVGFLLCACKPNDPPAPPTTTTTTTTTTTKTEVKKEEKHEVPDTHGMPGMAELFKGDEKKEEKKDEKAAEKK